MGESYLENIPARHDNVAAALAPQAGATDYPGRPEPTQRPVLFLDIDGVLNRPHDKAVSKEHVVARDLLARLKSLVSSTDAMVVMASTWRHEPDGLRKARQLGIPFEGVLPDLRPSSRGSEVKAWLAKHAHVDRFIIVDNDDDEYGDMPLFQPSPYKGLSPEEAAAIEEYFAGRRKVDWRRPMLIRAWQYLESLLTGHRG
jgi:hypothetical protein